MPRPTRAQLFAEYQREPRRVRRAVSRDFARANPLPAGPASGGIVGERMRRRRQMNRRSAGTRLGGSGIPTSGQARINAKRNQRAKFWAEHQRTVRITVSVHMETEFRQHLDLLGDRARIDGRTPLENSFCVDLDVHIPGAPADAVKAVPLYGNLLGQDGLLRPVLLGVEWERADGSRFNTPELPALV